MPDREEGYVRRKQGVLPKDPKMAQRYRDVQKESTVTFDDAHQRALIDSVLQSQEPQRFEVYYVATDPTHVHVLLGWDDDRKWLKLRSAVESSLTRHLNKMFHRREWLVEGGSRKHVETEEHFDYLLKTYLPAHRGWKWSKEKGLFK